MKRVLLGMLAIMMLVMSGCGDGSVSVIIPVEPVINPPSITSYRFTKDVAAEFIDGSVDFDAPGSDIDTMTVVVFDSVGSEMSRIITFIDRPGIVEGTIPFSIDYITYPAGIYTFGIYLTDFNGFPSNLVVDSFAVP